MRDKTLLLQMQALPLDAKILISQQRIREWYNYFNGKVFVSTSGGKDSTVLAHIVHGMYPEVPLVFANTGLEYPEIQAFARQMGAEFVRPKISFSEVISKHGYPLISKETAEAIHAARRIVQKKRTGVENAENHGIVEISRGGGQAEERVTSSGTNSSDGGRTRPGWKWADQKRGELGGKRTVSYSPPPMEKITRRIRELRRRRADRKTYRARRQLLH